MDERHVGIDSRRYDRRSVLAGVGALGSVGLAGCGGLLGSRTGGTPTPDGLEPGLIGSGREGRELPGGTPMAALPDLSGTLMVYSGRGEFLVGQLMDFIREQYPDLTLNVRYGGASDLANQIRTEGQASPADVFFTVNAGILGVLAGEGRLTSLPDAALSMGREGYQDPEGRWIGTSGRVRTLPYNTDVFDAGDLPETVQELPDLDRFQDRMGWAPTYGSFQGFVTVMRLLRGRRATREWLEAMVDTGVQAYPNEFTVARAIADGEIAAGLTNHYYILRVLESRPDAPIEMGLTRNDAGAFFNVAGAGVVDSASDAETAAAFVRHLLSAEAQDYFARSATFEYPMIPEVEPLERLPAFDALHPPDLDLAEFATADIGETIDLLEQAGVL